MRDIFDQISSIAKCKNDGELSRLLLSVVNVIGIQNYIYITIFEDKKGKKIFRHHIGCSDDWLNFFSDNSLYVADPLIDYSRRSSIPILISSLKSGCSSPSGLEDYISNLAKFGFGSGMLCPAHWVSGKKMGLLIVGNESQSDDDVFTRYKVLIRIIALEVLDWWVQQLQVNEIDTGKLREKDFDILRYVLKENSVADIAAITGLSTSQVYNRFRVINQVFGANSYADAALIAAEHGFIKPY